MSRDSDTNAGRESSEGEFSTGESGGDGDCSEYGEPMLEMHQTQDGVHRAQRQSTM